MVKTWTNEMKEILRTKYPKLGREICELLPSKTYEQIKRYAQKEGVSIRKHWTWTPSEENIIRTKGPIIGNKICSLIPNKTPVAIKSKMARMRIKVIHQAPPPFVLSEINSIRLAAFIDGEGAVGIEKQKCFGKEREGYSPFVEIGNTNIQLKEWLESVITTIHINWKVRDLGPPRRVAYIMDIGGISSTYALLTTVRPFLKLKEKQADLVLEYDTSRIGQPIHAKHTARQIEIYQTLRKINQRGLRLADDAEDAKRRYELLRSRRTSSRDEISRKLVMAASRINSDVEKDHLWTEKEIDILRVLYPLVGRKVFSILPKKSIGAIASKVQLMGLKLMNYPCPLSLEERDAAYLAGIIDGEGSIGIHEARSGKGKNYFQPKISINNSDIRLIEWVGKILFDFRLHYAKENPPNRKIVYHAQVIGIAQVYAVLSAVYPFLLLKKERAELVLEYTGSRIGKPKSRLYTERQKEIYHILREMHQKGIWLTRKHFFASSLLLLFIFISERIRIYEAHSCRKAKH